MSAITETPTYDYDAEAWAAAQIARAVDDARYRVAVLKAYIDEKRYDLAAKFIVAANAEREFAAVTAAVEAEDAEVTA